MKKIILFITSLLLFSCRETPQNKIQKEMLQWQGREIIFPNEIIFTKDSVPYEFQNYQHKILIYVDSTGCTPCKLKLGEWKLLMKELDLSSKGNIGYMFYFANKPKKEIEAILNSDFFYFPVVIDQENQLNKLNNFSKNESFHCFLLDQKNHIKIVGNPIYNSKIKELYFSEIQKK